MSDDDDILTATVPDADAEPTAAERAHARTFADLVDKTLAGRTPPAMSTDDRALLEVATVIRATHGGLELASTRRDVIVEAALRQAIGGTTAATSIGNATPITSRKRRWVPWAIAATSTVIAAAAIVLLWLRTPSQVAPVAPVAEHQELPVHWRSRPVELAGPIAREQSGDAISRIDYIFADRLDGFRERRLRGGKP